VGGGGSGALVVGPGHRGRQVLAVLLLLGRGHSSSDWLQLDCRVVDSTLLRSRR
jgi:hypothetical protein